MSEEKNLDTRILTEDDLDDIAGGGSTEKVWYVCQACGKKFKDKANKKWKGETVCKDCRQKYQILKEKRFTENW